MIIIILKISVMENVLNKYYINNIESLTIIVYRLIMTDISQPSENVFNWDNVNLKDSITFKPMFTVAKVVKVYDGDTITVATPLHFDNSPIYRFSVRLRGIDCPEIRTKNDNEKECGKKARKIMTDQVLNKLVTFENIDYDKYGRILADVLINGVNITKTLLEQRLAVEYNGGKKISPEDWLLYHTNGSSVENNE